MFVLLFCYLTRGGSKAIHVSLLCPQGAEPFPIWRGKGGGEDSKYNNKL